MRFRPLLFLLVLAGPALLAYSETTVDVSKEWAAHASSSTAAWSQKTIANVLASTAAVKEEGVCACDASTIQEKLDDSTYAFTGVVIDSPAPKKGKRTAEFEVDEIFKGSPTQEMKVSAEVTGDGCELPLLEDQKYLVFAKWEWGNVNTSRCMGTKLLAKAKTDALGPSEALKDKLYIKLRNACMGRYDTPCCLRSLKVMRAGYFVPEPEAGCPDGMIPDRIHCAGSYTWCIPATDKTHR